MNIHTKALVISFLLLISAMMNSFSQETEKMYLSGTGIDNTVEWEFFCTKGRKSGHWTTIPVPSNWEMHGFGNYNYGHDKPKHDEEGLYRYRFNVPGDWKGGNVIIVFEGSMTDTEVKINGRLAGAPFQGGFYRFSYDITRLLKYGAENLLEAKVSKVSADKSVEQAERQGDYWVFGGIYRPVYLESYPSEYISHTAIDARADGSLHIDVFPENIRRARQIVAQVMTHEGEYIGEPFSTDVSRNSEKVILSSRLENIKTWSPEFPNLYKVEVRLMDNRDNIHVSTEKFGFRTVKVIPGNGIYVNGEKIKFRGVNRHSFWPESGRALSRELNIADVNLMKDMNMNAVRMSHYPPDKNFIDACDSIGLFIINELAGWQYPPYDTEIGRKLIKSLVRRDVNSPAIVIWANGNEGGGNHALDDDFAIHDPQNRPVIHPWKLFRGLDTQHYKPWNYGIGEWFRGRDIFFPTEFLHGLYDGGHGAGLEDYWKTMWEHPLSAGGFLWVFSDEGAVRTDMDGWIDTDGDHAPDGILGPYREKEGSYFAIREIWSPVHIPMRFIIPGFDGTIEVENRFGYTSFDQCNFTLQLAELPGPFSGETGHSIIYTGKPSVPDLKPGEKGAIQLNLPGNWEESDLIMLTATDPHGREIYTWTWPVPVSGQMAARILDSVDKIATKVASREDNDFVYVTNGKTEVKFSKGTGMLSGVKHEGQTISFTDGPRLQDVNAVINEIVHYSEGESYVVEIRFSGAMAFNTRWIMHPDGWLELDCDFRMNGQFDNFGINFSYPEEKITGMRWMGRGPYRVWKNRLRGQQFGVWHKDYNNTVTGESWDYPEFKGFHSEMYWAVIENTEVPVTILTASNDLFFRMLTPERPVGAGQEHTSPPFPDGDISFLYGISAIGTKFHPAANLGPQSQKNVQHWAMEPNHRISLFFRFGE
jgi:hypothetical protein